MKNKLLLVGQKEALHSINIYLGDDYEVCQAKCSSEMMDLLEREIVQLIVCDVDMPVVNGWELCAQVKASSRYAYIPVVLIMAGDALQSAMKSLDAGADAFIVRPFSPDYLKAQIENLIINRTRIKAHFTHSPTLQINTPASSWVEGEFLEKLNELISDNIRNADLDVESLARRMNMSRPTFYRKIKAVTDLTPNELINLARLNRAAALLATSGYKIFEIAAMVGFQSQSSFGKAFLKQFKVTPTEYQQSKKRPAVRHGIALPPAPGYASFFSEQVIPLTLN